MAYLRYYDPRYGDLYEVFFDDNTGEFEYAARSAGGIVGNDPIYYANLSDLPPSHRDQIEHLIWIRLHPRSNDHRS